MSRLLIYTALALLNMARNRRGLAMSAASEIRIEFVLGESDLDYFRERLKAAQQRLGETDEGQIVAGAEELAASIEAGSVPGFLKPRVATLRKMIDMLRDDDWRLEGDDRTHVLNALAYFANENDIIPDNIPGIGLLDDAIMIDLAERELSGEIAAYDEFCENRNDLAEGVEDAVPLEEARADLQSRMRRQRRRAMRRRGGGSSSSYFLFGKV